MKNKKNWVILPCSSLKKICKFQKKNNFSTFLSGSSIPERNARVIQNYELAFLMLIDQSLYFSGAKNKKTLLSPSETVKSHPNQDR